jgi:hypothetical protein
MPNGGRTIPSTWSQPSAVRILKDAALQPVAASTGVTCSFCRLCFMPGCKYDRRMLDLSVRSEISSTLLRK